MAPKSKPKFSFKNLTFPQLLGVFGGGFFLLIVIVSVVASSASSKKKNPEVTVQTANSQTQQQPQKPVTADINEYMDASSSNREKDSLEKQLEAMNQQLGQIQGAVNQTHNNITENMTQMQSDLILLDQRLTNIEQNMGITPQRNQQQGIPKVQQSGQPQQMKGKGKPLTTPSLIQATVGQRVWMDKGQTISLTAGERIGTKTIARVDDIHNVVYTK